MSRATVHRPFRDARDLDRVHDLLRRVYAASGPRVRLTPGDLEYWRFQTDDPAGALATAELWFAADALAGFLWPGDGVLDLAVHTAHAGLLPSLLDGMLDWGEAWQRARARPGVALAALAGDAVFEDLLRARGYRPTGDALHWYRVRPLHDAVAHAPLPAGYTIRSGPDPDAIARLHAEAGAGPPIPVASYRALPSSPVYRADLDLVAIDAGGAPAAFALVWLDAANGAGLFEPVGCHPAHRRRGLASALLHEGLRRLRDLRATHALVANAERNTAAGALYEAAGFLPDGRSRTWRKRLDRETGA